jgi:hypothetical protein
MQVCSVLRHSVRAVLISFLLVSIGCLDGDKSVVVRYDPSKDEFAFLTVYQRIRADGVKSNQSIALAGEAKYLKALYANRDNLILFPPLPFLDGPFYDSNQSLLRLSDALAAAVSLLAPNDARLALHAPASLDDVQILPGKFFAGDDGTLAYYHQIVIPGSIADAAVAAMEENMRRQFPADWNAALNDELARRRGGERAIGWDHFSTTYLAHIARSMAGMNDSQQLTRIPFQTPTIRGLLDAKSGHHIQLHRQGTRIIASITGAAADVAGAAKFVADLKQTIAEIDTRQMGGKSALTPQAAFITRIFDPLDAKAVNKNTLELSIDIVKGLERVAPAEKPADLDAPAKAVAARLAQLIEQDIPVDKSITIKQLEQDFAAGTLSSYPQNPPVPVGTGLGVINMPDQ